MSRMMSKGTEPQKGRAMKTTTSALALHLVQPLTSLADCCRIQWQNGRVRAFTTHDQPLVIEGTTCQPTPSMQRFAHRLSGLPRGGRPEVGCGYPARGVSA